MSLAKSPEKSSSEMTRVGKLEVCRGSLTK